MRISHMKVCGLENPVGYSFRRVKISWIVEDCTAKKQETVRIEVAFDRDFTRLAAVKEGKDLSSACTVIDMTLSPRTKYYCRITVTAEDFQKAVSDIFTFETGKLWEPWEAEWICTDANDRFHPLFFSDFTVGKKVADARIYMSGLGVYEAWLNGQRIGDSYLTPYFNDYRREVQYQTEDITKLVREKNHLEILAGSGWYKGRFGLRNQANIYGDHFAVIAEIHLTFTDGASSVIKTDPSWHYKGSDIADSGIYDGEVFDRLLWENRENPVKEALLEREVYPGCEHRLTEQFSVPVRVCETLPVKEVLYTPAGELVLDFGQNFTGYAAFHSRLGKGSQVRLEYGEILQKGNFFNGNYREAVGGFTYVSDGREEDVRPHFTFFGGRYVRVSGWPKDTDFNAGDFTGCAVCSDLERTGFLETSDPAVNRLIANALWGQRSNFLDVPTDCPQRDERLGWTGDAMVFAPTACYNMDSRAFYAKYLHDLRVGQEELGGAVPNFVPMAGDRSGGSSVWGDSAVFIPVDLYNFYGDKYILEDAYPMMKDWVDYITRCDQERGEKYLFDFGFQYGDWLALDGVSEQSVKGATEDAYVASCYYYASAVKIAKAAKILGKSDDEEKYSSLAGHIKNAILNEYFTPSGRLAVDTQTGYIIALKFGLWRDKSRLTDGLRQRMDRDLHRIRGGFVGATMMCCVLAENGLEDEAWAQLLNHDYPGWLHCVDLGATTIWERWNSVLDDGTISGTGMNSLNHYAYGSVVEFIYRDIGGIQPAAPGFSKAVLKPQIHWQMKSVKADYISVSGRWSLHWKLTGDGIVHIYCEVPFNCTARLILPCWDEGERILDAGRYEFSYKPGKDLLQKYTMDSRLAELAKDPEAVKLLREKLPCAAAIIDSKDRETMSCSLKGLLSRPYLGLDTEQVYKAGEAICALRAAIE